MEMLLGFGRSLFLFAGWFVVWVLRQDYDARTCLPDDRRARAFGGGSRFRRVGVKGT